MTPAERQEESLRARQVREDYYRLHTAAKATAPFLKDEGLVEGELWDAFGADFILCFATEMRKLDDLGPDFWSGGDLPMPPSNN